MVDKKYNRSVPGTGVFIICNIVITTLVWTNYFNLYFVTTP